MLCVLLWRLCFAIGFVVWFYFVFGLFDLGYGLFLGWFGSCLAGLIGWWFLLVFWGWVLCLLILCFFVVLLWVD